MRAPAGERPQAPAASPRPPRVLLTGRPGSGKTTAVRRVVERIGPPLCAGFFTEEVRRRGRRIGFDVVTLDGQRAPLARAGAPGPRVSRYGVDVASFERLAVRTLDAALSRHAPVLVIDEIGKMELFSQRFVDLLGPIFDPAAQSAVLGTVMQGRHRHVEALRRRADIRIVQLTAENRERLPLELSEMFGGFLREIEGRGRPVPPAG